MPAAFVARTERKPGGAVKHKGAFSDLEIAADEANGLIMKARVRAGWIAAPVEIVAEDAIADEAGTETKKVEA